MAYKEYSDTEKAEALIMLAVNRYDFQKTADDLDLVVRTLRRWDKDVPKKGVGDLLERAIQRLLMVVPANMSGQEWAIAVGILMDKWLLMQGEPTERKETIDRRVSDLTDDEYEQLLRETSDILSEAVGGSRVTA